MKTPMFQAFKIILAVTALVVVLTPSSAQTLYVQQIKPALEKHCVMCHDGQSRKGGLDITTREALLRGGENGPAILPGNAKESLLYKLIAHEQQPAMPYKAGKLPDDVIAKLALHQKPLNQYSLETVKMFFNDAKKAGFQL